MSVEFRGQPPFPWNLASPAQRSNFVTTELFLGFLRKANHPQIQQLETDIKNSKMDGRKAMLAQLNLMGTIVQIATGDTPGIPFLGDINDRARKIAETQNGGEVAPLILDYIDHPEKYPPERRRSIRPVD